MILRPQGVDEQRTHVVRTSLEKTSSRCRKLGQGKLVQLGTRCASSLSGRVTPTRLHRLLSESVCSISPSHLLPLDVCHLTSGVDRRHLHAGTADSGVCRFIGSPLGQAVSTDVPSSCHPVLPLGERRTALSVAQSLSTTPRLVTPLTCHDTRCTRDRGSFSSSPSRRTVVTHWPCLCHQALPSPGRLTALWNAQDSRPSQMLFTPLASLDMFRSSLWRFSSGGMIEPGAPLVCGLRESMSSALASRVPRLRRQAADAGSWGRLRWFSSLSGRVTPTRSHGLGCPRLAPAVANGLTAFWNARKQALVQRQGSGGGAEGGGAGDAHRACAPRQLYSTLVSGRPPSSDIYLLINERAAGMAAHLSPNPVMPLVEQQPASNILGALGSCLSQRPL